LLKGDKMLKKIITGFFTLSLLGASNIKDNQVSINVNIGGLKIHDTSKVFGAKIGYYFYDPNPYKINNRIALDIQKVDSDASFYITSLKLDWIKNNAFFSPFMGINLGYLYFKQNNQDYSTNIYGAEAGIQLNISSAVCFEIELSYQKAFEKKEIWNTPLKQLTGGIEVSF
jgi:hypothetical protein